MRTAAEHVSAGEFEAARKVLDEAYAADPQPELLYSRAQVERIAGNCEEATRLYEQFAATASEEDAADARRLSAQCIGGKADAESEPPSPTTKLEPESSSAPPPSPDPGKPWSRRPLPAALMGVGVGAIGAGVGLLAYAATNRPAPDEARNEGHYGDLLSSNRRVQTMGVAVAAVGTGLAIGATVIWAVLASRQRTQHIDQHAGRLTIRF